MSPTTGSASGSTRRGPRSARSASFGDVQVLVNASQVYLLEVELTDTAALFRIDGVEVGELTGNLPGASTPLGAVIRATTLEAATKFVRWGRASLVFA